MIVAIVFRKCSATNQCFGSGLEQQNCNEDPCTVAATTTVGHWSGWSDWSICSTTCGGGFKRRTRLCHHGTCNGPSKDSLPCMMKHCKSFSSETTASWGGKYSSTGTIILTRISPAIIPITTQTSVITTRTIPAISYPLNSTNGTNASFAKRNLRRFWLFNNGSLSRTAEYDPVLLQIFL